MMYHIATVQNNS